MTNPEITEVEETFSQKKYWAQLIGWSVLLTFVLIGGIVTGMAFKHFFEGSGSQSDIVMMLVGTPLIGLTSYLLWKWFPDFTMGEPYTARGKRVRWMTGAVVAVGLVIAFTLLSADNERGGALLFGNDAVPFTAGLVATLVWAISMPVLIIFGRRNADEHRLAAQDFAMMVAFQFFSYVAPIWWMGWRIGMLPQPDVMILFVASLIVNGVVGLWKQS